MAPKYILEFFTDSELQVNITEHELVPKHIALTPEEKKELFDKYKLKENQLSRIQLDDPVVRYLGLQRGQVLLTKSFFFLFPHHRVVSYIGGESY